MFKKILGNSKNEPTALHQWLVLIAASLLFFYTFIQMNMLNPISLTLMHSFSISAAQLGTLSAMYFLNVFNSFILFYFYFLVL